MSCRSISLTASPPRLSRTAATPPATASRTTMMITVCKAMPRTSAASPLTWPRKANNNAPTAPGTAIENSSSFHISVISILHSGQQGANGGAYSWLRIRRRPAWARGPTVMDSQEPYVQKAPAVMGLAAVQSKPAASHSAFAVKSTASREMSCRSMSWTASPPRVSSTAATPPAMASNTTMMMTVWRAIPRTSAASFGRRSRSARSATPAAMGTTKETTIAVITDLPIFLCIYSQVYT